MIFTIIMIGLTFILVFAVPLQLYIVTSLYLYGLLVLIKVYRKKQYQLDLILFMTYFLIFIAQEILKIEKFIPFVGTIIYFVLFVYFLVRVFDFKTNVCNIKTAENRVCNLILFLANSIACLLSVILFPHTVYIFIPIIISILSIPISIFGSKYLLKKIDRVFANLLVGKETASIVNSIFGNLHGLFHIDGNFIGKEVCSEEEKKVFFEIIKKGYFSIYQKSSKVKTYEDFIKDIESEYNSIESKESAFVVYNLKEKKYSGCIRCVITNKQKKLPLERYLNINLTYKDYKKASELGRMVILERSFQSGKILEILILLVIVRLMFENVDVIVTDAMVNVAGIYEKMGLIRLSSVLHDAEFNQDAVICGNSLNNILALVKDSAWKNDSSNRISEFFIKRYLRKHNKKIKSEFIIEGKK